MNNTICCFRPAEPLTWRSVRKFTKIYEMTNKTYVRTIFINILEI